MGEKKLKWLAQKRHWLLDGIVLSAMHGHAQEPRPRVAAAAQLTVCEKRRCAGRPSRDHTGGPATASRLLDFAAGQLTDRLALL